MSSLLAVYFFCSKIGMASVQGTLRSSKDEGGSLMTLEEMKAVDVRTVSRDELVDRCV